MSHFISLEEAAAMTSRYRTNKSSVVKTVYESSNILAICETFDRIAFDTILSKSNCESVRIYYGMDEELKVHAIIVAVDGSGEDILPVGLLSTEGESGIIENGNRCPELCPPPSSLNS
jgi:hypothetical protein